LERQRDFLVKIGYQPIAGRAGECPFVSQSKGRGILMGLLGRVRPMRARLPALFLLCLSTAGGAAAQRIGPALDSSARVSLAGSMTQLPGRALDLGAAPGDTRLPLLSVHFSMTAAQQSALTQLLADQQNPASARYHQWLTPEQFGAEFGLGAADLAKVSGWLAAQGFTVGTVARGGQFIQFSGTVAQANAAFGVAIHQVSVEGQVHLANLTAATVPAALAAVTAGVAGLDDFKPTARVSGSSLAAGLAAKTGVAGPLYTSSGTHYLAPGDFYTIYDEKALITGSVTGKGVSVAVVGQTDINATDIAAFQKAAGLTSNPATVTLYGSDPGFTNAADLLVAEQGLEWVNTAAPGATLLYANSINALYGSLTLAVDNNLAPIVADGYGQCEAILQANNLVYYSQILEQAAAQGMTITAPSGQYGATDCDSGVATAVQGLAVDFPASSPLVTGVGGTEFNEGSGNYWSSTNGTNGGSALSYIPETVWNDDSSTALAASGGGLSLYFSKPAWQSGTGVPADFARDLPDVSLSGSAAHDAYLVCVSGSCTNGFANASGAVSTAGGTSVSASAFAGILALVEQKVGARLGVANPVLYALANSSYASTVFHDTTAGTNASPCTAGTPNCVSGGTIGFAATTGYDQATGWGSVDAYHLVNDWSLVTPTALSGGQAFTYTNVAGSASTVSAGAVVTLSTTVASAETTVTSVPTGSVQITVDSVATGAAIALAGGAASSSLNTSGLTVGTHLVQATYLGDANFQGSRGAFQLTVAAATNPDFTLTPAAATVTTASGTVAPAVLLTVSALNGFTGNVTFAIGTPSSTAVGYSFSNNPVVLSSTATSGTTSLSLFAYLVAKDAPPVRLDWRRTGGGVVLAGLMLFVLPRRRKLGGVLRVVLAFGAIGLSGCMKTPPVAVSNLPPTNPTPAGTYVLTVEATGPVNGTTVSHTSTITLVVQ
jgi:subtilase family serine protease